MSPNIRKPAGSPETTAPCTATVTAVRSTPCASDEVNAVCVDVIDHGNVELPWGNHPRISLVFETELRDENGNPKILTRTFNHYTYSRSALTEAIKFWLGLDISDDDEDFNLNRCVGEQARLRAPETVSGTGRAYLKIVEIKPAGAVCVQPSGNYRREKAN